MKGATVELKVCSRFEGSRILVVKGERNLRTCGLLEHNMNKFGANYNSEKTQVRVTFETAAELIEPDIITREEENVRYHLNEISSNDDEANLNNGGEELDDNAENNHNKNSIHSSKANSQDHLSLSKNHENGNELERDEDNTDKAIVKNRNRRHRLTNDKKSQHKHHKNHHQQQPNEPENNVHNLRARRDTILDRGAQHGGNAQNYKPRNESESISSFENSLLECFDGQILVAKYFPPSKNCADIKYLEQGAHLVSRHDVSTDGYYYYIFYSDNDDEFNHIHALFDIYKPTYLYSNISESKGCINSTNCNFKVQMFSDEVVIVEVPTRDGIEHEDDDITLLVSQCVPRMSVYIIFPILVLFFILGCAFI